jgi:predicted Zn-dependent protease
MILRGATAMNCFRPRLLAILLAGTVLTPTVFARPSGEIVAIQGSGEYRFNAGADWSPAKLKQALEGGSFLRTANASTFSLLLADMTQIKLGPNSMFQVKEVAAPPGQMATTVDLQKGKAWTQAKGIGALAGKGTTGLSVNTPSAAAAIHGTDWVIEVDDAGRTTLTVLTGEIVLANAQGSVTVRRQEQAVAEIGKAPQKRLLLDAEDRVQWLATYKPDWSRYPELAALPKLRQAIAAQDYAAASTQLGGLATSLRAMLGAELALLDGKVAHAAALLDAAPAETRLPVLKARVALYRGQFATTRDILTAHLAQAQQDREAWLLLGEVERLDGQGAPARAAYERAAALPGQDGAAQFGLGKVDAEREDIPPARHAFAQAQAQGTLARGELGQLETLADNLDTARVYLDARLAEAPDDVVALAGLGLLELKAGQPEAALETLARAQAIEPRYARTAMLAGIAYYQQGRIEAARTTLQRAADLDPRDPLPHMLLAQIARDRLEPDAALEAARAAARLMPNLKSLNQLANDQKGGANVGSALAAFGLESWAMSLAQQAAYPYWAGSHLFLADRYAGTFTRNSELMAGFLADPTVFGADPKASPLVTTPGHYQALSLRAAQNGDSRAVEPSFAANGLFTSYRPIAYFVEGIHTRLDPRDYSFDANADTLTFGVGAKPTSELSLFAYGSRFRSAGDNLPLPFGVMATRIEGEDQRLDLGGSYRLGPEALLQFKLGGNDSQTRQRERSVFAFNLDRTHDQRSMDAQLAYVARLTPRLEIATGLETWNSRDGETTQSLFFGKREPAKGSGEQLYLAARWGRNGETQLDGGLYYQHHAQDREDLSAFEHYRFTDSGFHPRVGIIAPLGDSARLRAAYQSWRRPAAYNSLAPVATAGLPLADQFVLPGGKQDHLRLQGEWELTPRHFVMGFAETMRVDNIAHNAFDGAENQRQDLARLDRLRQAERALNLAGLETLEDRPVFVKGRIEQLGISWNGLLRADLAAQAGAILAHGENTSDWFAGLKLPYLPSRRAGAGVTWTVAPAWRLQAQAVWRGERFADEANSQRIRAGWDGTLKATWLSPDRHVNLEAFAANLGRQDLDPFLGLALTWRL